MLQWDVIGNLIDFFLSYFYHQLMVLRFIADIASDVFFFQPAHTVLKAWRSWYGPWANQFFIAQIRQGFIFARAQVFFELHFNGRKIVARWIFPRLSAIGNIAIAQKDNRRHVLY